MFRGRLRRHRVVHFHVTANPTTESAVQQLREAVPLDRMRRYLLRITWLLLGGRIRRRPLRGSSRVGLEKGRQECADGREQ